jgi:hypothetical protein
MELILQFHQSSCHLILLMSKYCPQHPESVLFPQQFGSEDSNDYKRETRCIDFERIRTTSRLCNLSFDSTLN